MDTVGGEGTTPEPDRYNRVLFALESVTVITPAYDPSAEGRNVTVTLHDACATRVPPHEVLLEKSVAPVKVMLDIIVVTEARLTRGTIIAVDVLTDLSPKVIWVN